MIHPSPPDANASALPEPVAVQAAFEADPANQIKVADTLRRPHPLVRSALDALDRSAKADTDYVGNWQVRHLDLDTSKASFRRALRVMDALLRAFEGRGWRISLGTGDDRKTYVHLLDTKIAFGIRETRKKVANEPAKPVRGYAGTMYPPYTTPYREEPSGKLALVVRNSWGHGVNKSWVETASRPIEKRLNDFALAVLRLAHEEVERERRFAEAEARRRAEEGERLERKRQREREAARANELEAQAERWRRSRSLLAYLRAVRDAVQREGDPALQPELENWLEWAERHAKSLDPLGLTLGNLLKVPGESNW